MVMTGRTDRSLICEEFSTEKGAAIKRAIQEPERAFLRTGQEISWVDDSSEDMTTRQFEMVSSITLCCLFRMKSPSYE